MEGVGGRLIFNPLHVLQPLLAAWRIWRRMEGVVFLFYLRKKKNVLHGCKIPEGRRKPNRSRREDGTNPLHLIHPLHCGVGSRFWLRTMEGVYGWGWMGLPI